MKARREFEAMHEDCIAIVRGIKIKNDLINKKHGVESEAKLLLEIQKDKHFFEAELTRLKSLMTKMEENYLDPDSMRKLQMVKKQAKKQITRNEQLIKQLISSSFEEIQAHEQQMRHYQHAINYTPPPAPNKITTFNPYEEKHNQSQMQQQDQIVIHDEPVESYELQQVINKEKIKVLLQVERDFHTLNGIINETAQMVNQQGQHLDIITDQMIKTHNNVETGNAHLIEAAHYQRQAKKKYIVFAFLIILLCLAVGIPVIMMT